MKKHVILDIGTKTTKAGFSGEAEPRTVIECEIVYTSESLKEDIKQLLKKIFSTLMVNARNQSVVICESHIMPISLKKNLITLLCEQNVQQVGFLPSALMNVITTGSLTGISVIYDEFYSCVTPVFEGHALMYLGKEIEVDQDPTEVVINCIEECPLDIHSIKKNIVSDIELRLPFKRPGNGKFKHGAWVGASILLQAQRIGNIWTTRLTDWTNKLY